jgi:hypothetical protein
MTHYVVGYFDDQHNHHDICTSANDCWEAQKHAREDSPYLSEHPHAIDSIIMED